MIGQSENWAEFISSGTKFTMPTPPKSQRWTNFALVIAVLCLCLLVTVAAIKLTGAEPLGMSDSLILLG